MKLTRSMQRVIDVMSRGGSIHRPYDTKSHTLYDPDLPQKTLFVKEKTVDELYRLGILDTEHVNTPIRLVPEEDRQTVLFFNGLERLLYQKWSSISHEDTERRSSGVYEIWSMKEEWRRSR